MRLRWLRNFVKDKVGQDLIEYALMAGFVAVAAGALVPSAASGISTILSRFCAECGSVAELSRTS